MNLPLNPLPGIREPIYSVFTMLEAVRLIDLSAVEHDDHEDGRPEKVHSKHALVMYVPLSQRLLAALH
jgi:hypothetical protein